ncbi:hypothetical protein KAU33_12915 [Candidatus Dependentiae bacterium]|nr:hypothetical protein [Candidatus Dependentiae bacterium]
MVKISRVLMLMLFISILFSQSCLNINIENRDDISRTLKNEKQMFFYSFIANSPKGMQLLGSQEFGIFLNKKAKVKINNETVKIKLGDKIIVLIYWNKLEFYYQEDLSKIGEITYKDKAKNYIYDILIYDSHIIIITLNSIDILELKSLQLKKRIKIKLPNDEVFDFWYIKCQNKIYGNNLFYYIYNRILILNLKTFNSKTIKFKSETYNYSLFFGNEKIYLLENGILSIYDTFNYDFKYQYFKNIFKTSINTKITKLEFFKIDNLKKFENNFYLNIKHIKDYRLYNLNLDYKTTDKILSGCNINYFISENNLITIRDSEKLSDRIVEVTNLNNSTLEWSQKYIYPNYSNELSILNVYNDTIIMHDGKIGMFYFINLEKGEEIYKCSLEKGKIISHGINKDYLFLILMKQENNISKYYIIKYKFVFN